MSKHDIQTLCECVNGILHAKTTFDLSPNKSITKLNVILTDTKMHCHSSTWFSFSAPFDMNTFRAFNMFSTVKFTFSLYLR